MISVSVEEQKTINSLQDNWVWVPEWVDSSNTNTAGRVVRFTRQFDLEAAPESAILHFTADTRYKLYVNGVRISVGPARSSQLIWYYDTLDIAPHLRSGHNEVVFLVLRYFMASRVAMPFARTPFPGLTVVGNVPNGTELINLSSREKWEAQVDNSIAFPTGLVDDGFLHINERIHTATPNRTLIPLAYGFRTQNGELAPWRLRPRAIPLPDHGHVQINTVRSCQSDIARNAWVALLSGQDVITLPAGSSHRLDVQADVHSTAFLKCIFRANGKPSQVKLKITYSEGYELEPRSYPFFRRKADRLDAKNGLIIGPSDEITMDVPANESVEYEPFWFRTFRILRLEFTIGLQPLKLLSISAIQVNYPLDIKASWSNTSDKDSKNIWDVSIRTMRNCMFDGYSDCPFYEQLQYSGDSRSVGLFHYLLSGDDRLTRQAITNFAASVTFEGLTQSRFPSHVPQIIAGFSLYWVLQVCDHHLYFGDSVYSRSLLPRIDGVLEFFYAHIDGLGLISGFPEDVWQYVDWVITWGATDDHPDKGVPTSGRKSNRHTYFSMLYAYTLQKAAQLSRDVGRPGYAEEYEARAERVVNAVRTQCFDGRFFTDSTTDVADALSYSQHCQVFGVLCGATTTSEQSIRLLADSFSVPSTGHGISEHISLPVFSKCSYVMMFYAFRAFAAADNDGALYEAFWPVAWNPWRRMLAQNLSTWEEDDVRQRSDCHAWGSVPIYEYCTELAGIQPTAPGIASLLFKPRLRLSTALDAKVALGHDNIATVSWRTEEAKGENNSQKVVELGLLKAIRVTSVLPGGEEHFHGVVDYVKLVYTELE